MVTTDVLMPVFVTRGTLEDELIRYCERMQDDLREHDADVEAALRRHCDECGTAAIMQTIRRIRDERLQPEKVDEDTGTGGRKVTENAANII